MTPRPAEALAVVGEQIVAVGQLAELTSLFPSGKRVDFGHCTITPGFNDAHIHLAATAEDVLFVDLSANAVRSPGQIKEKLSREAALAPAGQWIRATRYDDAKLPGAVLTRGDLDEASRDHPIVVVHVAGHWGVLNSRALQLAGITDRSEPPPGGRYGRDASGRLNGVLFERALMNLTYSAAASQPPVVPPISLEDRMRGLQRAIRMFHASGLTSIGEALVGPEELALLQEADRRELLTIRVNMLLSYQFFELIRGLGLRSGFGSTRLRFGGVKAFVDGALGGRTCLLEEPYEGTTDHGMQITSTKDLAEIVQAVQGAGSQLAVHANGDRAILILLDQLEASQARLPNANARPRIEHCSLVNDEILRRMRGVGAVAVPFATYVHYHGAKLLEWYGPARLERMFAHRSFLEAGIPVAGSSDHPCGPFEPLLALQACVTREGADGTVLGATQRITPGAALNLYTTGAAYASGEERVKGKLAPGYLADFAVLADDPLQTEPRQLASIPVIATFVGGRRVWPPDGTFGLS